MFVLYGFDRLITFTSFCGHCVHFVYQEKIGNFVQMIYFVAGAAYYFVQMIYFVLAVEYK